MPTTDERAAEIRRMAKDFGLTIHSHNGIVSVSGRFTPGDLTAYLDMEVKANKILNKFRQVRAGSQWGTDGGSVGGGLAIQDGRFVLNKSGCEKRLAAKF
jgi:hypothetical protein